jgi:hypothetical protein
MKYIEVGSIKTVFPWIKNKNKDYMKGDLKLNKIMILKGGSPAIHKMGNIGRKIDLDKLLGLNQLEI